MDEESTIERIRKEKFREVLLKFGGPRMSPVPDNCNQEQKALSTTQSKSGWKQPKNETKVEATTRLKAEFEVPCRVEPMAVVVLQKVEQKAHLEDQPKSVWCVEPKSLSKDRLKLISKDETKTFPKEEPEACCTAESRVGLVPQKVETHQQKVKLEGQRKYTWDVKTFTKHGQELTPKVEINVFHKAEPAASFEHMMVPNSLDAEQRERKFQYGGQRKFTWNVGLQLSSKYGQQSVPKVETSGILKTEPDSPFREESMALLDSHKDEKREQNALSIAQSKSGWKARTQSLSKDETKPILWGNLGPQLKKGSEVERPKPEINVEPRHESTCHVHVPSVSPGKCSKIKYRSTPEHSNQDCSCERSKILEESSRKMEMEIQHLADQLREKQEQLSAALKTLSDLTSGDTMEDGKDFANGEMIESKSPTPPPPPPPPPPLPHPVFSKDHNFTAYSQKPTNALSNTLPRGMKPKTTWDVTNIKRAYWKPISPEKISGRSFWLKVQEEQLISTELLRGLMTVFSTEHSSNSTLRRNAKKEMKESDLGKLIGDLTINFFIGVQRWLKEHSIEAIKRNILSCNHEAFSVETLNSLLTFPPEKLDEIRKVKASKDDLNQIHTSFLYQMAGIDRLFPRLHSMKFRIQQPGAVEEIKPKIETCIAACRNIFNSGKLKRILELILLFGNIMNSGSSTGPAYAFEMSFLSKLSGVKDTQNKTSLLHFLVDTIEDKYPDLLAFKDELIYVPTASKVSLEDVSTSLKEMEKNISQLKTSLEEHVPQNNEDKFSQVMGPFYEQARREYDQLSTRFDELRTIYNDLADYFALDQKIYNTKDLLLDLKLFIDAFTEVHKGKLRIREAEEAKNRRKLSREASILDRRPKLNRKDFNTSVYRMMAEEDRLDQANGGSGGRIPRRSLVLDGHNTL
ncbi:hypothetical protein GE061_001715 [Apolygus lucorum]|uniref:FH2 domain-containing protein n=1 Tax=Apolygus lucorum TaxID=248454 RepID=A0A8S9YB47_APOLU|nr:hypothetical protein GE061_001715 [Apolygus lucorum]